MSGISYRPPSENLAIFDPSVFLIQDQTLTYDIISNNFLQFPTGQGTETIPALNVPGNSNLGVTNVSTLNLSQTLNIANGLNTSTIDMDVTNNLVIDNNVNSGSLIFKSNNSVGIEQTILTLNGDTGLTTSKANVNDTLSIFNGANSTTLDMNASNDFTILNNVNSQGVGIFTKNSSGVNDTSLIVSSGGLIKAVANGLAFTAQNSGVGVGTGQIYMGVGSSGIFNNIVQPNDSAIVGASTIGADNGALSLTCWNSNSVNTGGIRITKPTINMRGDNIELNANTLLTSTTPQPLASDSSTKVPTTAWVQSAISASSSAPPSPYYQVNYLIDQPSEFGRYGNFQFTFVGTNFGINEFFSFNLRCSLTVTNISTPTALATGYTTINCKMDVYPARCPSNIGNPSAYGVNPTQPNVSNFSLTNGAIYIGGGSQSGYVLSTGSAPYAPYGRWYFPTLYSISSAGVSYQSTNPAPFAPFILGGTPEKTAFGFGLWGSAFVQTNFAVEVDILNKPIGVGKEIGLVRTYSVSGGNTVSEVIVGF